MKDLGIYEASTVVRIFDHAPRGTVVYEIPMETLKNVTHNNLVHTELSGSDSILFSLSENVLAVDQWPRLNRRVGSSYQITILIRSTQSGRIMASIKLTIIVSKRNLHSPVFMEDAYYGDVFRFARVGTTILRLNVSDEDEEPYNREVKYVIPPLIKGKVQMVGSNGTMAVGAQLRNASDVLNFTIKAIDGGSPSFSATTNVSISVRNTSGGFSICGLIIQVLNMNHLSEINKSLSKFESWHAEKFQMKHGAQCSSQKLFLCISLMLKFKIIETVLMSEDWL